MLIIYGSRGSEEIHWPPPLKSIVWFMLNAFFRFPSTQLCSCYCWRGKFDQLYPPRFVSYFPRITTSVDTYVRKKFWFQINLTPTVSDLFTMGKVLWRLCVCTFELAPLIIGVSSFVISSVEKISAYVVLLFCLLFISTQPLSQPQWWVWFHTICSRSFDISP